MEHPRPSKLIRDTRGLTTVEYAILGALVAVVSITAWNRLGGAVTGAAEKGSVAVAALAGTGDGASSDSGGGVTSGLSPLTPGSRPHDDHRTPVDEIDFTSHGKP